MGFGGALTNRYVTDAGHAALGLRLLGAHPRLIFYTPSITDQRAVDGAQEEGPALPAWLMPGLVLIGLAVLTLAVVSGRRLGRLVPEPLPVVVKASETTHSRAELYRAAQDRARTAAVLRRGTLGRLRSRLRLDTQPPRTPWWPRSRHTAYLWRRRARASMDHPDTDAALVRLATDLATLGEGDPTMTETPTRADAPEAREALTRVRAEVAKAVVGQDAAVAGLLVGLLARGHVLLEGVPGVAKTLLVRSLAAALAIETKRVQFTPDLMPGDITGSLVHDARISDFTFRPGPVFTNLLLADEINRTPPKTQSALLEAMEERQVSVDGVAHPLPSPFLVAATQNPVEYEGTYPLPEAQLDRFLLKVVMPVPPREQEIEVLARHAGGFDPRDLTTAQIAPVAGAADLEAGAAAVRRVEISPEVIGYVVDLARATRNSPPCRWGQPRGATALMATARVGVAQRTRLRHPDDVKALAKATLAHRLTCARRPNSRVWESTPSSTAR